MTTCPTCHQPATRRDGFDRRGRAPQEIANRGRGDSMTQPADLARDALVAPPRVLAGESKDQLANLGRQSIPSRSPRPTTEDGPTPADKSSVPTDDCFRPDDQLRPGIALNAAQERGQDEPIARPEARLADLPFEDPKLMPEDQEFSLAIVCRTTPTGGDQDVDHDSKAGVEERGEQGRWRC